MMTNSGNQQRRWILWSFVVVLAMGAGPARALRPGGEFRPRIDGRWRAELLQMGFLEQMYRESDWETFRDAIENDPASDDNADLMLIPVSLGNVYLNDYELRRSRRDFDRSVAAIEWVAVNDRLWTGRRYSGTIIAYLELTLSRLEGECDVGAAAGRLAVLREKVDEILQREAAGRLINEPSGAEPSEVSADTAALYATAASFLPNEGSSGWEELSRPFAAEAAKRCPTPSALLSLSEGALAFALRGRVVPVEFQQIAALTPPGQPRVVCLGSGATRPPIRLLGIVPADQLEEDLAAALWNSRLVAQTLTGSFLWRYSPGAQCEETVGEPPRRFVR